jgi:extracellular elastinolytic metalloproteinase
LTPSGAPFVYTSPPDAFPGSRPRPVAPNLIIRTFRFAPTRATHLRLVVLTNQCTGGPHFQGDQDADPANNSDCVSGSSEGHEVVAADLEAFSPGA